MGCSCTVVLFLFAEVNNLSHLNHSSHLTNLNNLSHLNLNHLQVHCKIHHLCLNHLSESAKKWVKFHISHSVVGITVEAIFMHEENKVE